MSSSRVSLLSEGEVQALVSDLATHIAPRIDNDTIAVCLLTGGLWFAADLMRALARLERHPVFDALWLSSYGDATVSTGRVTLRAGVQRPIQGAQVLLIDDVFDSGLSLASASKMMIDSGAGSIVTAVFARKPWPTPRDFTPDFVAWEAPDRFLLGYGMDEAGRYRGLPGVEAVES